MELARIFSAFCRMSSACFNAGSRVPASAVFTCRRFSTRLRMTRGSTPSSLCMPRSGRAGSRKPPPLPVAAPAPPAAPSSSSPPPPPPSSSDSSPPSPSLASTLPPPPLRLARLAAAPAPPGRRDGSSPAGGAARSTVVKHRLYSWMMDGYSELKSSSRTNLSYSPRLGSSTRPPEYAGLARFLAFRPMVPVNRPAPPPPPAPPPRSSSSSPNTSGISSPPPPPPPPAPPLAPYTTLSGSTYLRR